MSILNWMKRGEDGAKKMIELELFSFEIVYKVF